MFFSEEKNQKTFILSACPTIEVMSRIVPLAPEIKVFLLLFLQKKKILSFSDVSSLQGAFQWH
jgi:hypothetical protein